MVEACNEKWMPTLEHRQTSSQALPGQVHDQKPPRSYSKRPCRIEVIARGPTIKQRSTTSPRVYFSAPIQKTAASSKYHLSYSFTWFSSSFSRNASTMIRNVSRLFRKEANRSSSADNPVTPDITAAVAGDTARPSTCRLSLLFSLVSPSESVQVTPIRSPPSSRPPCSVDSLVSLRPSLQLLSSACSLFPDSAALSYLPHLCAASITTFDVAGSSAVAASGEVSIRARADARSDRRSRALWWRRGRRVSSAEEETHLACLATGSAERKWPNMLIVTRHQDTWERLRLELTLSRISVDYS